MEYINKESFELSSLNKEPYPYLHIPDSIKLEKLSVICRDFPEIEQGGSFPLTEQCCKGEFKQFIEEVKSDELRSLIGKKLQMDLTPYPPVVTLRGFSRKKDGRIHTDSKSKIVTVLIYFNEGWNSSTGNLRVLNGENTIEDYVEEVPSSAGTCLMFKVTRNCWHGYLPYEGVRRSIQLNYVVNESAAGEQVFKHKLSAKFKSLKRFFGIR
jgi:SM-20-related protein